MFAIFKNHTLVGVVASDVAVQKLDAGEIDSIQKVETLEELSKIINQHETEGQAPKTFGEAWREFTSEISTSIDKAARRLMEQAKGDGGKLKTCAEEFAAEIQEMVQSAKTKEDFEAKVRGNEDLRSESQAEEGQGPNAENN